MRILVDAQLPPALARWFREQGYESMTDADCGLRDASDSEIWEYALQGGWIAVTKDQDFAARIVREELAPQIVWLRIGNSSNDILIQWFEPLLAVVVESLKSGARIVEVQRQRP